MPDGSGVLEAAGEDNLALITRQARHLAGLTFFRWAVTGSRHTPIMQQYLFLIKSIK